MTNQRLSGPLATEGWMVMPKLNRLVMFDASYLHGVIPGRGLNPVLYANHTTQSAAAAAAAGVGGDGRRLTFMVGFWRDISATPRGQGKAGPGQPFPYTLLSSSSCSSSSSFSSSLLRPPESADATVSDDKDDDDDEDDDSNDDGGEGDDDEDDEEEEEDDSAAVPAVAYTWPSEMRCRPELGLGGGPNNLTAASSDNQIITSTSEVQPIHVPSIWVPIDADGIPADGTYSSGPCSQQGAKQQGEGRSSCITGTPRYETCFQGF